MTDLVSVSNLCVHGHHGVFPEETTLGQKFYIDMDCETDFARCAETDDHLKAVNYGILCELAVEVSEAGPYKLIETLGDRIAQAVLDRFAIVTAVHVRVRKPSAPLATAQDYVGISLTRRRERLYGFSFGSNIGEKAKNVATAIAFLAAEEGVHIQKISKLYRTAPWGKTDQDWFVNACAIGKCDRSPLSILKACKRIEAQIGRVPTERWGPRLIDVDILFAENLEIETAELTLPHPAMFDRGFVLVPLAEIAADLTVGDRQIGEAAEPFRGKPDDVVPLTD